MFRLTVVAVVVVEMTPLRRSISNVSPARCFPDPRLDADKAGCFPEAVVGDGAPVESRLSVARGLNWRACAA